MRVHVLTNLNRRTGIPNIRVFTDWDKAEAAYEAIRVALLPHGHHYEDNSPEHGFRYFCPAPGLWVQLETCEPE